MTLYSEPVQDPYRTCTGPAQGLYGPCTGPVRFCTNLRRGLRPLSVKIHFFLVLEAFWTHNFFGHRVGRKVFDASRRGGGAIFFDVSLRGGKFFLTVGCFGFLSGQIICYVKRRKFPFPLFPAPTHK